MDDNELHVTTNFVWKEFELAFCYAKQIRIYTDDRRKRNRHSSWFLNLLVCLTSLSFLFEGYVALFFSIASSVFIFLRELIPSINQPEEELTSLDKAADFFAEYQIDMERLYYELMFKHNTTKSMYNLFFELKKRSTKYYSIVNKFYRGISKKKEQLVKNELSQYATIFAPN